MFFLQKNLLKTKISFPVTNDLNSQIIMSEDSWDFWRAILSTTMSVFLLVMAPFWRRLAASSYLPEIDIFFKIYIYPWKSLFASTCGKEPPRRFWYDKEKEWAGKSQSRSDNLKSLPGVREISCTGKQHLAQGVRYLKMSSGKYVLEVTLSARTQANCLSND